MEGLPAPIDVLPAIADAVGARATVMLDSGVRSGLDVARAIALGATAGGMAAPVLRAWRADGEAGAREYLDRVIASIRTVCLLAGCASARELRTAPRHLGPGLRAWLADLGIA